MADTYDITAITPRTRSAPGGVFQKVQNVAFVTKPSGIAGEIDVADDIFVPETVNRLVSERAALLESVKKL